MLNQTIANSYIYIYMCHMHLSKLSLQRRAREEAEQKAREKDEALTPEERRAEMLRRQKLQEEADLRLAMETFGLSNLVDFSSRKTSKEKSQKK